MAILTQHEEVQFESIGELPDVLRLARRTHIPAVQILLFNPDGEILTMDEDNGKRVLLPDAIIHHPYGAQEVEAAAYQSYGIDSAGQFIGKTLIKAIDLPWVRHTPRIFVPVAFPWTNGADMIPPPRTTAFWRTPDQALELLAVDDVDHGVAGSQRRDIARFGIQAFQKLPVASEQA